MQASGPKAGSGGEAAGQAVPHRSTASGNSGHLEPGRPTTEISLKWTHRLLLRLAALADCFRYALLKIGVTVAWCI